MARVEDGGRTGRLTLTRKVQQGFWIGPEVHIIIASVERGRVKLTIEAPEKVLILRDELRARHGSRATAASSSHGKT